MPVRHTLSLVACLLLSNLIGSSALLSSPQVCPGDTFLNAGSCVSVCPAGTFPVSGYDCDASCSTCSGTSATECLTCPAGFELNSSSACVERVCPAGTFKSGTDCAPCASECATCAGTASTCTSCSSSLVLTGSTCSCPTGTYQTASGQCSACDSECTSCAGASNNCLSCGIGYSLTGQTCAPCPAGQYGSSLGTCSSCDPSCTTCTGPGSDKCLTCSFGYTLSGSTCVPCPSDTLPSSPGVCRPCYVGCTSCTLAQTQGKCVSCRTGYNPVAGTGGTFFCMARCSGRTYMSSLGPPVVCSACPADNPVCSICDATNPDNCLQCAAGATVNPTTGKCACPENRVFTGSACAACNSRCRTCSSTASNACTTCFPGATLVSGMCLCPSNQYFTGSSCQNCHPTCRTCSASGSSSCLSCYTGANLSGGICSCPDGTYFTGQSCATCDPSCSTCTGPNANQCSACSNPNHVVLPDGTCGIPILERRWDMAGTCDTCHANCATCSGPTANDCLTCAVGLKHTLGGECVSACPAGSYAAAGLEGDICALCSASCATCSSATECTSCPEGTILCSGQCLASALCPSGFLLPVAPRAAPRSECPRGLTACPVPGFRSWECVDTARDLESCGGCVYPEGGGAAAAAGQDCTAIVGVADVSCRAGRCAVKRCMLGFEVHRNRTACVESGRGGGGLRDASRWFEVSL